MTVSEQGKLPHLCKGVSSVDDTDLNDNQRLNFVAYVFRSYLTKRPLLQTPNSSLLLSRFPASCSVQTQLKQTLVSLHPRKVSNLAELSCFYDDKNVLELAN